MDWDRWEGTTIYGYSHGFKVIKTTIPLVSWGWTPPSDRLVVVIRQRWGLGAPSSRNSGKTPTTSVPRFWRKDVWSMRFLAEEWFGYFLYMMIHINMPLMVITSYLFQWLSCSFSICPTPPVTCIGNYLGVPWLPISNLKGRDGWSINHRRVALGPRICWRSWSASSTLSRWRCVGVEWMVAAGWNGMSPTIQHGWKIAISTNYGLSINNNSWWIISNS